MALLDRSFRGKCTPEILSFQRVADIQKGEGDLRVELSESELARYIYTYLHYLHIIYTISTHYLEQTEMVRWSLLLERQRNGDNLAIKL